MRRREGKDSLIGWKTPEKLLTLALCLLLFTGAALPPESLTPTYTAETVLCGEAVCPVLLPGSEDGSVLVRWFSPHVDPVDVVYGPDDGAGARRAAGKEN